jgi:hypothetical protein
MINGASPAVFLFLPMLGKHPDEYPRFRDCFLADPEHPDWDDGYIHVYTRTGGGNREEYVGEIQAMRDMETFITDFDDNFDNTYASWVFKCPDRWKADYDKLLAGKHAEVSEEYVKEMQRIYPKIADELGQVFITAKAKASAEKQQA